MKRCRGILTVLTLCLFARASHAEQVQCPFSEVPVFTAGKMTCTLASKTGFVIVFAPENYLIFINTHQVKEVPYDRQNESYKINLLPGNYQINIMNGSDIFKEESIKIEVGKGISIIFASPKLLFKTPNVTYAQIRPEQVIQKWELLNASLKGIDCVWKDEWKPILAKVAEAVKKAEPTSCLDIAGVDDIHDFVGISYPEIRAAGSQEAFHAIRAQGRASLIMYRLEMDYNVPPQRLREGKIEIKGEKGVRGVRITLVKDCAHLQTSPRSLPSQASRVADSSRFSSTSIKKKRRWEAMYDASFIFGVGYHTYLGRKVFQTHQVEFKADFNSVLVYAGMRLGTADYQDFMPGVKLSLGYNFQYLKPRIGILITAYPAQSIIEYSLTTGINLLLPIENLFIGPHYEVSTLGQHGYLALGYEL